MFRKTTQHLLPATRPDPPAGQYDIYPAFPVGPGKIDLGYEALAERLAAQTRVVVDGYPGVLWENFRQRLDTALCQLDVTAVWISAAAALRPPAEIEALVAPFLGGDDPLFGTRYTGSLRDFFDSDRLAALQPDPNAGLNILYGCGAALAGWDGLRVYVDVPKNEIQFRFRAGSVTNLGSDTAADPKAAYKRCYFVDWVAANRHKAELLPLIDLWVDEQRPDEPALMAGAPLRAALSVMARNYIRVRPWFEPGPWGGQWIKERIPGLAQAVPNYAWSFELIVPENGLLLESDGRLLEVSFDCLMAQEQAAVLGQAAQRFGAEFPIRFDFLDTVEGGNLSIQCHPRPAYIREHFGETFTQDETYYILDHTPGARAYLGFRDDIDPAAFRQALEHSASHASPLATDDFVQSVPTHRHDLLLIPNATIHGSGAGNLVLEISATPYIFTFKLYDWLRLDLEGKPRQLNLARGFENLDFERRGQRALDELISKPVTLEEGHGWRLIHLPTHAEHFYDVHRLEFNDAMAVDTEDSVHVLSLVEGQSVLLETAGGLRQRFSYAETFVVPAAAGRYRLISDTGEWLRVIKCFIKPRPAA
ncbi:MAG: class I mannose-6-phosphate isomerase [Anaerolineales bacterium]